ncbi:hypothetical protein SLEP1_g35597 [Rubroshorea leprosula]|uniref:Ankyrin repeat protein n=1 Tax=Rubroshorea leprosula TaxID=152421 RepID=A0AAV5KP59_9ROSI|nr:hypothetical protein SLEP1_g35597 [Rubroshorea leprosula]
MAAANRHLGIVEYLIAKGVEKSNPLHWACLNGHLEVVKKLVLVLAGANGSTPNSHEWTPIDKALSREKTVVMDAINAAMTELELAGASVS